MQRKLLIFVLAGMAFSALWMVRRSPVPLGEVFKQPLQSLWGSPRRLQTGVLEVSENIAPVQEATRRLLTPLGKVRLIQRFPPESPASKQKNHRSKR